jgi:serine/threonine protein kinase
MSARALFESLVQPDSFRKQYDIDKALGEGKFAKVYKARRKCDGKDYAVKVIAKKKLQKKELPMLKAEIDIMVKVRHPNCIELAEVHDRSGLACRKFL